MANEENILRDLGMDNLADMSEESNDLVNRSLAVIAQTNQATVPYLDFSRLQAAALAEREMAPEDKMLFDPDRLYSGTDVYRADPNDRPEFEKERRTRYQAGGESLKSTLIHSLNTQPLPAKGDEGFSVLERDIKELAAMNEQAKKEGKTFGQIWLDGVSKSKMSYLEQTKYAMEARQYELILNNKMTPQKAAEAVKVEFAETFRKMEDDPEYMRLMSMSSDELSKEFAKNHNEANAFAANTARLNLMSEEELELAQFGAGLLADIATGFVPFVGTATGLYMAGTGDDIFINAFTGKDYKLRWWERGLMVLPIAGPLYRAIRHPIKTAAKGGDLVTRVVKSVDSALGQDVGNLVKNSGPSKLRAAIAHMREIGKGNEIDDILRGVKDGSIRIADEEQTLLNVLRSVSSNNAGTARAILRSGSPPDSPIIKLAQHAIATGDERARKEIVDMILNIGDDLGSSRAKALMDTLGADSDAMKLLLRDMRSVRGVQDSVSAAERTILDGRRQIEIKKQRLENLKKAREVAAEKRAAKAEATAARTAKVDAELNARAEAAPMLEETATGDAPIPKAEEAPVNTTIKGDDGGDVRVVEQTPETTVTINAEGQLNEIIKGLDVSQRTFIIGRVKELGSMDAVKNLYHNDSPVHVFARKVAAEEFGAADELIKLAEPVKKLKGVGRPKRVKGMKKDFDSISDLLFRNADDAEATERLNTMIAQLESDIKNFPDQAGKDARMKLLGDAREMKSALGVPDTVPTGPKVEANLSGQTDASLEAIRVEKSRKAKGIKMKLIDTRSGKITPAVGIRPEDAFNPTNSYQVLVEVEGDAFKVVSRGDKAKPMTEKMMGALTKSKK
jgi:hypothetical protein